MADKQYDVSPELQRAFVEKQAQRKALREYYIKHVTNPHRHATGEGGFVFDEGVFRQQAMRAKKYDYFRPTPKNGFSAFMLVGAPLLIYGYFLKRDRDEKERSFRSGEVSYRDRRFKQI